MRVLIAGATGFVDSCLARRLLREEHTVHVFIHKESNTWRLEDIRKNITEHRVDLRDAALVDETVGKIRPQVVYHLATYGGFAGQKDVMSILMNSGCPGMVRQFQDMYFNGRQQSTVIGYGCSNLTEIARAYGLSDYTIASTDNAEAVIDQALSGDSPAFVDMKLEQTTCVDPKLVVTGR